MQLLLVRDEGGVDLRDPVRSGVRARAAVVMERGPALRSALHEMYPGADKAQLMQAEGLADADDIIQRLASQSISIGAATAINTLRRPTMQCLAAPQLRQVTCTLRSTNRRKRMPCVRC